MQSESCITSHLHHIASDIAVPTDVGPISEMPSVAKIKCLATLQKHLGYFNHIFRLSQLHQCDQGMLLNRFS